MEVGEEGRMYLSARITRANLWEGHSSGVAMLQRSDVILAVSVTYTLLYMNIRQ